jgi:hypothetical protein
MTHHFYERDEDETRVSKERAHKTKTAKGGKGTIRFRRNETFALQLDCMV